MNKVKANATQLILLIFCFEEMDNIAYLRCAL